MKNKYDITWDEVLVVIAIMMIIIAMVCAYADNHRNYHYDVKTRMTTWTDGEGRNFIKSPDGLVTELKNDR